MSTDGSLLGTAGKWEACGWAVVQLDNDEEMQPVHGMYGSMEAEFEVQRTIKRTGLTAFKVHVDNKGTIDGITERTKKMHQTESWAMLTCGSRIWERIGKSWRGGNGCCQKKVCQPFFQ